jgi:hypothetical protein
VTGQVNPRDLPGILQGHENRIKAEEIRTHPPIVVPEFELCFDFPGALTVDYESLRYYVFRPLLVFGYAVTEDTASSNSTTWTVYKSGVSQGTIAVAASTQIKTDSATEPLIFSADVGDYIQMAITDGSDGADALVALRARRV